MTQTEPQLKKRLEERLEELPVLPAGVARLLCLDPEDDDFFEEVLATVEIEPSYSTRILAVANSAASGGRVPITTLRAALSRIGGRGASDILLALSVSRILVPRDEWEKSLWRHAIQVAIASRELARRASRSDVAPEEAYACGLLHDIGRFVLFQEAPDELKRIDEGDWGDREDLVIREKQICGLDHAELGALACTRWGLPDPIAHVVRSHHAPANPRGTGAAEQCIALVQVADIAMFPSAMPGTPGLEEADDDTLRREVQDRLPPSVALSLSELRELLRAVASEADEIVQSLGL